MEYEEKIVFGFVSIILFVTLCLYIINLSLSVTKLYNIKRIIRKKIKYDENDHNMIFNLLNGLFLSIIILITIGLIYLKYFR